MYLFVLCLQCNTYIINRTNYRALSIDPVHVKCICHIAFSHSHINAVQAVQSISITSVLIFNTHLHLALPDGLFLLCFPTRTSHAPVLTFIRFTLLAHPMLLKLTTSLKRTNHETPHYTVPSSSLLPRP